MLSSGEKAVKGGCSLMPTASQSEAYIPMGGGVIGFPQQPPLVSEVEDTVRLSRDRTVSC
jgi:hypothetical protein